MSPGTGPGTVELSILGSGAAFSETGHNAAYLVDRRLLLDCGAPVTSLLPPLGTSIGALETILISHLHGDHVIHLPTLLVTRRLRYPEAPPLRLIGPRGLREHLPRLGRTAFGDQLWPRIVTEDGPLFTELEEWDDGQAAEVGGYAVEAFTVRHAPELNCLAFRIERDGISLGYTGDTTYCPGLLRLAATVDNLLCECSSFTGPSPTHLWHDEVARLIEEAPRAALILTHLTSREQLPGALLASDGLTLRLRADAGD